MRSVKKTRRSSKCPTPPGCEGYILITLVLFVALLAITVAAIAPSIVFQVKRDREEELIHRGVQYSRAIKRFVKKAGNYPTRLEQLDNTNQIRFLRKRYKDPITGKDFKLLHQGEVPTLSAGLAVAGAGALAGAAQAGQQGQQLAGLAAQAIAAQAGQSSGVGAANPGASLFGDQPSDAQAGPQGTGTQTPGGPDVQAPGGNAASGSSASSSSGSSAPGTAPATPGGQVFGSGGPIVGVASTSKAKTIRVFAKKDHYNQWQFIYDPSNDRGGLISTPYQSPIQNTAPTNVNQPGGSATTPGAGFSPSPSTNPGSSPAQQPILPQDTPLQQ